MNIEFCQSYRLADPVERSRLTQVCAIALFIIECSAACLWFALMIRQATREKKLPPPLYQKTFRGEGLYCERCKSRVETVVSDIQGQDRECRIYGDRRGWITLP